MKTFLRIVIAVGILFLVSYFQLWLITLSVVYGIVLLSLFIYTYWIFISMTKTDNLPSRDFQMFSHIAIPWSNAKRSFWRKTQYQLVVFFNVVNSAVCWPAALMFGKSIGSEGNSSMETIGTAKLQPSHTHFTSFYFIVSVLLYVLIYFNLIDRNYTLFYTALFTFSIICYLLSFLMGINNFASIFKSSPNNIFKGMILVSLGIALSLFLFFSILLVIHANATPGIQTFKIIFNEFVKQQSVSMIWDGKYHQISPWHLLIDLSGLIFAATIIDSVKSPKSFQRDSKDILAVSYAYMLKKEYHKALIWLEKTPRSDWDTNYWNNYSVIKVALNQPEKAIASFPHFHVDDEDTDYVKDHKYYGLISGLNTYGIAPSFISDILKRWHAECGNDEIFSVATTFYFNQEKYSDIVHTIIALPDLQRHKPLTFEMLELVNPDCDIDHIIDRLRERLNDAALNDFSRSVTHAFLITFLGSAGREFEDHIEILEANTNKVQKEKDLTFILIVIWATLKSAGMAPSEKLLQLVVRQKERLVKQENIDAIELVKSLAKI